MIDHLTWKVRDYASAVAFYRAALEPLGYRLRVEYRNEADDLSSGHNLAGFGTDHIDLWFSDEEGARGPFHFALGADTRAQVDAFHAAALAAGGRDNGAPGLRPHYHAHYYGAFVLDPDGNNVEAVCHAPEARPAG